MNMWGATYTQQRCGSMDFWDSLNKGAQDMRIEIANRVREADRMHPPTHQ
jgi:hypothetical protein